VETAQRRVEQQNFSIRKRTLEYDDVMNKQREVIYTFRGDIVRSSGVREKVLDVINDLILTQCEAFLPSPKDARVDELLEWTFATFPVAVRPEEVAPLAGQPEAAADLLYRRVAQAYEDKCAIEDPAILPLMERQVVLHAIDTQWQEYLRSMDELRHGVGLRAYGQRDPLVEYKREAFHMFEELMSQIKLEIAQSVFRATTSVEALRRLMGGGARTRQRLVHDEVHVLGGRPAAAAQPVEPPSSAAEAFDQAMAAVPPAGGAPIRRDVPKVGRNDPCPCGSGRKYKKCCGQNA
jgi:preprotein translocase subunit SecA